MPEGRISKRLKAQVTTRAGDRCEYCRCPAAYAPDPFSVEHIHPRSGGGATRLSNLALSCQGCNSRKYTATSAVDPATGESVPLFHPRQQKWRDHFTWTEDHSLVIGLTATGRATIDKLDLNRPGVVNLRRLLSLVSRHPPEDET